MIWLKSMGTSLLLTLLIEAGAALALGKRGRALAVVALVNLLTNPPAAFVALLGYFGRWPCLGLWIICIEVAVPMSEALVYRRFRDGFRHPWLFSLLLNGLSFGAGIALQPMLYRRLIGG